MSVRENKQQATFIDPSHNVHCYPYPLVPKLWHFLLLPPFPS